MAKINHKKRDAEWWERNPEFKDTRVLIVDDEEHIRESLSELLLYIGLDVVTAASGEDALKEMKDNRFDIAFVDIKMPVMDGVELLGRIGKEYSQMDVIMLSGYANVDIAIESLKLGAYDFLQKPCDNERLKASIKRLLEKRKLEEEHKQAEEELRRAYKELEMRVQERTAELRVSNKQLKLEIEERKKTEEALQKSEERYRQITETVTDYIFMVRIENGRPVETIHGPACLSVTGYSPEEYASDPNLWIRMVHEEDREAVRDQANRILSGQDTQPVEHRILRKDGVIRWVKITLVPHYNTQRRLFFYDGLLEDITERKQHEREMEAICTLSAVLRSAPSRADMIPLILEQLLDILKARGVLIAMLEPVSGETVIELALGDWESWNGLRLPPGEGVIGHIISTSEPYSSDEVLSNLGLIRPDVINDLRAIAGIPLIAEGHTIGAILIGRRTKIFSEELRLLTAIAEIAASAIYRDKLHEQTVQHLQRFSALHTIDMAIIASFDLQVTLKIILPLVTTQLAVDAAAVLLLNPYTQTLGYAAGHGFRSYAIEQTRLKLGEGHAGRAALERQTINIPNAIESQDMCALNRMLKDDEFISSYVVPLIAKGQVKGVLEIFHRSPLVLNPECLDFLEALAAQTAIAIDNASLFNDLQRSNVELVLAYDTTIEGWSLALDYRDKETEGHSRRVTEMTLKIASAMGMSDKELVHIRRGALLHDIGKLGVPDAVLFKPGKLNEEEWEIMKRHPILAYELLSPISYLRAALDIPYYHHEKWDGRGYPHGLKGEQIPLAARMFAVVDVWDALSSDRPYRPAWAEGKIMSYITDEAGKHFDPKVVEMFLKLFRE